MYARTENGTTTLTKNTFTGNSATDGSGGGAYVAVDHLGSFTLSENNFSGNTATHGGGVYTNESGEINSGPGTLNNNTFTGNTSTDKGGGAHIYRSGSLPLINNTFIGNTAPYGGGIHISGSPTLTNNTLTANDAESEGGGVWLNASSEAALYNNILWNNSASEADDLYIDNTDEPFFPVTVNLFNNDFDRSSSGTYITEPFTIDPSNLDNADPLFEGSGDYHLTASSPCINTGDNDAPDLPTTDKDGNPRIVGGTVDMGAYEFQPVLYVNKDDETCGGKTPCYTSIQEAINGSSYWSIIMVVGGNYEENIILNAPKTLSLKGGYDSGFTTRESYTTVKGSLVVSDGKIKTSKIKVHFQE